MREEMNYQGEKFLCITAENKIIVVQGKNRGIAKCHPEDERRGLYDPELGLAIAIARMKAKRARKVAKYLEHQFSEVVDNASKKIGAVLNKRRKAEERLNNYKNSIRELMEEVNRRYDKGGNKRRKAIDLTVIKKR